MDPDYLRREQRITVFQVSFPNTELFILLSLQTATGAIEHVPIATPIQSNLGQTQRRRILGFWTDMNGTLPQMEYQRKIALIMEMKARYSSNIKKQVDWDANWLQQQWSRTEPPNACCHSHGEVVLKLLHTKVSWTRSLIKNNQYLKIDWTFVRSLDLQRSS